ncbi:MAG: hypothetical protein ABL864_02140 [Terricaulis sp.]
MIRTGSECVDLVNSLNAAAASALLSQGASGSFGLGADVLTAWVNAKAGVGVDVATAGADPNGPRAPVWTPGLSPNAAGLLQRANDNKAFFDTDAKLYTDLGATGDYKRLFALHSGLSTLQALAGHAQDETLTKVQQGQTAAQFARGMRELEAFFAQQQFEDVRLAQGDRVDAAQTTMALPSKSEDYQTGIIHRGALSEKLAGLDADAAFEIVATSSIGTERRVAIDLSEMGSLPRSLGNVVSFINSELAAAGAASRLSASDLTPKTNTLVSGGRTITSRYTGPKQYALMVDVRAGEKVAFEAAAAEPAFYVVGAVKDGARLIKLSDVGGEAGQPHWLARPSATADPIGANVATGWLGPGAPYGAPPSGAYEQRTNTMASTGANNFETAMHAPGEAVLKLQFADGRVLSVSTAWRGDDLEGWRTRSGESEDRAMLDDLSERLTQLLHEQGVAAGIDVWESGTDLGLSVLTGDFVSALSLSISGRAATFEAIDPSGMVGGLRDGVFARRFEAASVASANDSFVGDQSFLITTESTTHAISIDGGSGGINAAALVTQLNDALREKGLSAAASLYDNGGVLDFRFDALHDTINVSATLNQIEHDATLQAPGAWASGGLPAASAGQMFGDGVRDYDVTGGAPLSAYTGALDIELVVATPSGDKTITVSVSALERANDPDPAPGEWSANFQARLDAALNAAGVYVGAAGADLTHWSVAESAGQRIVSLSINGVALALEAAPPALGLGGAFSVERSFTSAEAATSISDDVTALLTDQNLSISFNTLWGERTVTAALEGGDARSLESAALRLNEALAAAGYDVGLEAVALSGGGAGLRIVSGASHSVRGVASVTLGGVAQAASLDPIDSASHADDPVGAARVAARAARGAALVESNPSASTFTAPTANAAAWFPGRAFDISVGGGAKVATARAVAVGADGGVYVLADLDGDSASSAIKGARDVALFKYDSAGKLAFTHMLGAAQSASGFALAVSADGKVAVAGAVEGGLSNAGVEKGGTDSFVMLLDAAGKGIWTARRGASANDEAHAVAFAPDGGVVVAGTTDSALGVNLALGGADAYVRGFSAGGAELFTRQFGTAGADAATALLVRDDGAGGLEIFSGGVEDNRGIVRRFTYDAGAGFAPGATRDIGYFHNGAINAIAAGGTSLYVAGEIGADRLNLGAAARGAVAGQEGFVARLDSGLVSTANDRATYLGSAQEDSVKGLAIVGGNVYAAGISGGVLAGQGSANGKAGFLTRLDDAGEAAWTRTFNSASGSFALAGLAADPAGRSALDALGLPRGVVAASDGAQLTSRSALRVGDEFKIGAEGRRSTTIKISATDTMASLVTAINRAMGAAGGAQIVRENGAERIKINARDGQAVRIAAGRAGHDALPALGLAEGIVALNSAARGGLKTFGLGLAAADLKLDTKANIIRTKAELSAAVSIVRQAYDALLYPNAKEPSAAEKALAERRQNAGPAPAYYSAQLANYQAALARLGG